MRLDRWFKREYPDIPHGLLQKLLRKGRVRLDGRKVQANTRIEQGQRLTIPPLERNNSPPGKSPAAKVSKEKRDDLAALVIYRDSQVLAINKPAGMAVQGGSKVGEHLDAMLDALRFEAKERPRLVHRLDRDTSGVLLLGRTAEAARKLTEAFRQKNTEKVYWALVIGVPHPLEGEINLPLAKGEKGGKGKEKVGVNRFEGKPAMTRYRVVEHLGKKLAWLELTPVTGRTHQLRVHCAAVGHPILGDGKYGGREAFPEGVMSIKQLHLHARRIVIPRLFGNTLDVSAPLPGHMKKTWKELGLPTHENH